MQRGFQGPADVERALRLVGELLEAREITYSIVVIGGSALNLLGVVGRATTDVDIVALAEPGPDGALRLARPGLELPAPLANAALTVAEDLGLDPHWLNTGPESQWRTGLPPGLEGRITWRGFGGLNLGVVGRQDLVWFKLYAAADDVGPRSVHYQDLLALQPTDTELDEAGQWVRTQDPTPEFGRVVEEVIRNARQDRDRARS